MANARCSVFDLIDGVRKSLRMRWRYGGRPLETFLRGALDKTEWRRTATFCKLMGGSCPLAPIVGDFLVGHSSLSVTSGRIEATRWPGSAQLGVGSACAHRIATTMKSKLRVIFSSGNRKAENYQPVPIKGAIAERKVDLSQL